MTWIRTERLRPLAADADLTLRIRTGNSAAFELLAEKFWRPLVGFVFRMVHDQTVAEEMAQEAFLRLYRTRSTYAGESQFATSLYRVAANLAISHVSEARETQANVAGTDQLEHHTGLVDTIQREIDALPHQQRIAVLLHKYQGFGHPQIAEVLQLSESAAKFLLFTAYLTLREKLKEFM